MDNNKKVTEEPGLEYGHDSGLLKLIKYGDFEIEIKSYCSTLKKDSIRGVLETYRKKTGEEEVNANKYWEENKKVICDFIADSNISYTFKGFQPDYIQIIPTSNQNIQELKIKFKDKILSTVNTEGRDFSDKFRKTQESSVVGMSFEEAENIWNYNKPDNIDTAHNVLIIDDTINKGKTIRAFIEKLLDTGIITKQTKIKAIILYNQQPSLKTATLEDIKRITKK